MKTTTGGDWAALSKIAPTMGTALSAFLQPLVSVEAEKVPTASWPDDGALYLRRALPMSSSALTITAVGKRVANEQTKRDRQRATNECSRSSSAQAAPVASCSLGPSAARCDNQMRIAAGDSGGDKCSNDKNNNCNNDSSPIQSENNDLNANSYRGANRRAGESAEVSAGNNRAARQQRRDTVCATGEHKDAIGCDDDDYVNDSNNNIESPQQQQEHRRQVKREKRLRIKKRKRQEQRAAVQAITLPARAAPAASSTCTGVCGDRRADLLPVAAAAANANSANASVANTTTTMSSSLPSGSMLMIAHQHHQQTSQRHNQQQARSKKKDTGDGDEHEHQEVSTDVLANRAIGIECVGSGRYGDEGNRFCNQSVLGYRCTDINRDSLSDSSSLQIDSRDKSTHGKQTILHQQRFNYNSKRADNNSNKPTDMQKANHFNQHFSKSLDSCCGNSNRQLDNTWCSPSTLAEQQQMLQMPAPPPRVWVDAPELICRGDSRRSSGRASSQGQSTMTSPATMTTTTADTPMAHQYRQQQQQRQRNMNSPQATSISCCANNCFEFTVLSYNVLSDRLVNTERYPSSPKLALDWSYRREQILKQLLEFDADIVALQELEMHQFEDYFAPGLRSQYQCLFEPKSRARTMDQQRRRRVDGCAIFFKQDRFKLIQSHLLEFNQLAVANARGSAAMIDRVMTKDNIGLVAVLEMECCSSQPTRMSDRRKRIVVCNTHIHWDPMDCDVKLIQTIMLMNELKFIASYYSDNFNQSSIRNNLNEIAHPDQNRFHPSKLLPLVLLGDFNSLPNSGVTKYLTSGSISSTHKDFKGFQYTTCNTALTLFQPRRPARPTCYHDHEQQKNVFHYQFLRQQIQPVTGFRGYHCTNNDVCNHSGPCNGQQYSYNQRKQSLGSTQRQLSAVQAEVSDRYVNGDLRRGSSPAASMLTSGNYDDDAVDWAATNYLIKILPPTGQIVPPRGGSINAVSADGSMTPPNNGASSTSSPLGSPKSGSSSYSSSSSLSISMSSSGAASRASYSSASQSSSSSSSAYSSSVDDSMIQQPITQQQHQPVDKTQHLLTIANLPITYRHPFTLESAYGRDTMTYTNYTTDFKAVIDYVFYSSGSLQMLGLLGELDKGWLAGNRIKGLPQMHLPSDHLPLMAKLGLTGVQRDNQQQHPHHFNKSSSLLAVANTSTGTARTGAQRGQGPNRQWPRPALGIKSSQQCQVPQNQQYGHNYNHNHHNHNYNAHLSNHSKHTHYSSQSTNHISHYNNNYTNICSSCSSCSSPATTYSPSNYASRAPGGGRNKKRSRRSFAGTGAVADATSAAPAASGGDAVLSVGLIEIKRIGGIK